MSSVYRYNDPLLFLKNGAYMTQNWQIIAENLIKLFDENQETVNI